jgi:hypothetical protein
VRDVKYPNWASAIQMNPRNVFSPSILNGANLDDATEGHERGDADVQDIADAGIIVSEFNVPDEIIVGAEMMMKEPMLMFQS